MWSSTVGLVNGKHRYLTAETFGFKINSNGQVLKKRQQWTIEPFPENVGPDGSISSAASVSSQSPIVTPQLQPPTSQQHQQQHQQQQQPMEPNDSCILTFNNCSTISASLTSIKSSSNGSSTSDPDGYGEEHENVAIKSHLNKYLAVDSFGNVTCDSDEKTENARFTITICSMSQGRSKDEHIFWAFKNVERGYYLGTTDDGMICCDAKVPKSRAELWHLHLIPARGASFFAIKSLGRKRYARIVANDSRLDRQNASIDEQTQVQLDSTITWGPETLFQFKYYEGGRYSLLTSDCMYLTNEGKCINWSSPSNDDSELPPPECLFTLEYHSGFLAFRDSFCHYLAAAGRSSVLRSRSIGVSRDELFVFEPAPIQVALKATFNNRWVSCKQGVDLSANQTETTSKFETFQLTYHKQTQNWSIMTHDCNFWTVSNNGSTISVCKPGDYEGLTRGQFKLIWSDTDATCSVKYIDLQRQERWIAARKSGQLFLGASATQEPVKFIVRFQNRRLLNLRPVDGSGFVGLKANSKQLEANKTMPDSISIEYPKLSTLDASLSNGSVESRSLASGSKTAIEEQQTINVFNVKLNSTKMGQSIKEKLSDQSGMIKSNDSKQDNAIVQLISTTTTTAVSSKNAPVSKINECIKESCQEIDDNNNNECSENFESKVESEASPSVASLINSFSKTKIKSNNSPSSVHKQSQANGNTNQSSAINRANSSVIKLASSFSGMANNNKDQAATTTTKELNDTTSDTASVITSCSTASSLSSSNQLVNSENKNNPDQLAISECCYLKTISNEGYLTVGNGGSSILCEATNRACAQPWILELRSHNSIAIRASDNHAYVQLGTNGTITLSKCDPEDASLWEF